MGVGEIGLPGAVAEGDHFGGAEILGGQGLAFVGKEGVTLVVVRQRPAVLDRGAVERAAGKGLTRIHVHHLGVQLKGEVECLLHRLRIVVGEAEDVVGDDVHAAVAHLAADFADVDVLERPFGDLLAHTLVAGLDAEGEPVDAGLAEEIQIIWSHGVHARVGPHPQLQAAVDDVLEQRLVVALVEEEHLVGDADGLDAHCGEFLERLRDEVGRPVPHVRRVGRDDAVGVVHAVHDIDHAEVALEPATERGVERGERRAFGVVELRVPEMGAVEVERLLVVRQQVPRVTGQVEVHPRMRHDHFGRVQRERAALLVADSFDIRQVLLEIGRKEIVQRVHAFVE